MWKNVLHGCACRSLDNNNFQCMNKRSRLLLSMSIVKWSLQWSQSRISRTPCSRNRVLDSRSRDTFSRTPPRRVSLSVNVLSLIFRKEFYLVTVSRRKCPCSRIVSGRAACRGSSGWLRRYVRRARARQKTSSRTLSRGRPRSRSRAFRGRGHYPFPFSETSGDTRNSVSFRNFTFRRKSKADRFAFPVVANSPWTDIPIVGYFRHFMDRSRGKFKKLVAFSPRPIGYISSYALFSLIGVSVPLISTVMYDTMKKKNKYIHLHKQSNVLNQDVENCSKLLKDLFSWTKL